MKDDPLRRSEETPKQNPAPLLQAMVFRTNSQHIEIVYSQAHNGESFKKTNALDRYIA